MSLHSFMVMLHGKLQVYKCHSIMYELKIYIYIIFFLNVLEDTGEWDVLALRD